MSAATGPTRPKLTRDEMTQAMRAGVLDLLEEMCTEDGFDTRARDAGRRALSTAIDVLLATHPDKVAWHVLEGRTVEEVRVGTREAMREDVRKMLAPLRPS